MSATPENIDASSQLRMKPTRLNYFNRPETELYGTAPYQTLGHRNIVDTESSLFFGNNVTKCDRTVTETTFDVFDPSLNIPLAVDTQLRPVDTQAQLRNTYCQLNKQKINSILKSMDTGLTTDTLSGVQPTLIGS